MPKPDTDDGPAAAPARPRSMSFRKRRVGPLPTPDQSRRQSALIEHAWRHFREAAPMIAFLNTRDEGLGEKPLQLAIDSDDGLRRVREKLDDLTRNA